jgi:hypothetical protein
VQPKRADRRSYLDFSGHDGAWPSTRSGRNTAIIRAIDTKIAEKK